MTMEIEELTLELGAAYRIWKDGEKRKNELKDEFFEIASSSFPSKGRATQVVPVGRVRTFEDAREIALKANPFWKIVGVHNEDGDFFVGMEEDVSLKPFAFVNPIDGMVYQRSVVEGSIQLDDERMRREAPDLWKKITVEKVVQEVKPFEELDGDTLEQVAKYLYQDRPSVKFLAPRPAREDELGS